MATPIEPEQRRSWVWLAFVFAVTVAAGCADLSEQEFPSACCDCLVEHACTDSSRLECGRIAAGNGKTLIVDEACSNSHGCGPKCAAEGFSWL